MTLRVFQRVYAFTWNSNPNRRLLRGAHLDHAARAAPVADLGIDALDVNPEQGGVLLRGQQHFFCGLCFAAALLEERLIVV